MQPQEVIKKKRDGKTLSREDIQFFIGEYVTGRIPDYQMSSFLMAVYLQGMGGEETAAFTQAMIASGEVYDLSSLGDSLIDKHSTGGVGDKVSLLLAPMMAASGLKVPMMTGRSLGHTGGTTDKLETIPGYRAQLSYEEFVATIGQCGYAFTGQSEMIAPADKKVYALRDVSATVESASLIASSILSKKFAEGCTGLVLDVKCGHGGFMKTREEAHFLAQLLLDTAGVLKKDAAVVITNMDVPLGYMVGNFLEVEEAALCLNPEHEFDSRSADLMTVTRRLGAWMLYLGKKVKSLEEGEKRCSQVIQEGRAYQCFLENVRIQGGDPDLLQQQLLHRRTSKSQEILAGKKGSLTQMNAYKIGLAATYLGAGRTSLDSVIQPDAGIELQVKPGMDVLPDDVIYTIWYENTESLSIALEFLSDSFTIGPSSPRTALILEELYAKPYTH